jgi:hypothetical protein
MHANSTGAEDVAIQALGPFRVHAEPSEITEFAAALGLSEHGRDRAPVVPAAFPLRWLSQPSIREALHACTGSDRALVHETQEIIYGVQVKPDTYYNLNVTIASTQSKLVMTAQVIALTGELVCTLISKLLLVGHAVQSK